MLLGSDGRVLPVDITISSLEGNETVAEGFARVIPVPAGTYLLTAKLDELNTFATTIEVTAGAVTEVNTQTASFGGVRIRDERGAPLNDVTVELLQIGTDALVTSGRGVVRVLPQVYTVRVGTFEEFVTVEPQTYSIVTVPADALDALAADDEASDAASEAAASFATPDTGTIQLVDAASGEPVTDIEYLAISLDEREYVYIDESTQTLIVPPGDYEVRVGTIIPYRTNVTIAAGETIDIAVTTETGTVQLVDATPAANPSPMWIFTSPGMTATLYTRTRTPLPCRQATMRYGVDTIIPYITNVTVTADETITVIVPLDTGTIQLVDAASGEPITDLSFDATSIGGDIIYADDSTQIITVPPGDYEVRVDTIVPYRTDVTVTAGEAVTVAVSLDTGTIQLVDAASGEPITDLSFDATSIGGDIIYADDSTQIITVPPGDYEVRVDTIDRYSTDVTVTAGETVTVAISLETGTIQLVNATTGEPITDAFYVALGNGYNYVDESTQTIIVPPGEYIVRVELEIQYFEYRVEVNAGETTRILLPDNGTIMMVDENGAPLSDLDIDLFEYLPGEEEILFPLIDSYVGKAEVVGDYIYGVNFNAMGSDQTAFVMLEPGGVAQVPATTTEGVVMLLGSDGRVLPVDITISSLDGNETVAEGFARVIPVPAGSYLLTARLDELNTFTTTIEVTAGAVTEVNTETASFGAVRILDERGAELYDVTVELLQIGTDALVTSGRGVVRALPQEYTVRVGTFEELVTVEPQTYSIVTVPADALDALAADEVSDENDNASE